jgi:lipid II:glycine glycyltransferase (peptidoglycan interpeptide bridge formation enzyme)
MSDQPGNEPEAMVPAAEAGSASAPAPSRLARAAAVAGVHESAMADPERLRIDDRAWDAFVTGLPTASFLQMSAWARVKRPNGWTPARLVARGTGDAPGPVGAQVLMRRAGGSPWAIGYAARGPLGPALDADGLAAFAEEARARASELRISYLRIEPELEDDPALAAALERIGWRKVERSFQPSSTRLIDLARKEEDLWADLRPKWRQYVNKAPKSGITVSAGGAADLPAFYALYEETATRAGFYHREEQSYRAVWDAFAPGGMVRLLFARSSSGEPLATLFLLGCGQRMTEVYGGMNLAGAGAHANYLLKWEAIRRARDEGFAEYDLWGLAHPGIAHFKAGFGGREVRYIGAWDLVFDPFARTALEVGRRARLTAARVVARARGRR